MDHWMCYIDGNVTIKPRMAGIKLNPQLISQARLPDWAPGHLRWKTSQCRKGPLLRAAEAAILTLSSFLLSPGKQSHIID